MKLYKITFSPTGGTKKVADAVASAWNCPHDEIDLTNPHYPFSDIDIDSNSVCLIAVPSFGGRVPKTAASALSRIKGNNAYAVLIVVYGNRAYDDTLCELKNILCNSGFICTGAVTAIAEHSIMRQFAAGRPNTSDIKELNEFGQKIKNKIENNTSFDKIALPGNRPYREYNGLPLKPKADKKCNNCGICAELCPTGAISKENPHILDDNKCITCMKCISICPQKARKLNNLLVNIASRKLKKICTTPKNNELFL